MQKVTSRLGALPYILLGMGLSALGALALDRLTNLWPFDAAQRLDLVRLVALGQADAAMLLEAALPEMIMAFLSIILVISTGVFLPIIYFLNWRFKIGGDHFLIILRQAMWVGIWITFCFWLQMNRALGIAAALLVAAVLVLVELLLQVRTQAAEERKALQVPNES
jgi:hypothetical protein